MRIAGLLHAALALGIAVATLGLADSATGSTSVQPALGMVGPYDASSLQFMHSVGVTQTLVEMSWATAEPAPGVFNDPYLRSIGQQVSALRAAGYGVALNTGMMNAPTWFLHLPGARFVDQNGSTFTEDAVPNLVFATNLRPLAEAYLATVFKFTGTNLPLVRAGGGFAGELTYPSVEGSKGKVQNRYWAFDENALRQDPVPSWRPGQASPHGEATAFLNWYLNALVGYQNWQVTALRQAGYVGSIAMLYPSYGMRPGDFQAAVADNLNGQSSAEVNGEVQRGYDFARLVSGLTDMKVVVYSTWGDNPLPVTYLAALATQKGLHVMAENGGGNTPNQVATALATATALHLSAFYLVRAPQFSCGCNGYARASDVASLVKTPSTRPAQSIQLTVAAKTSSAGTSAQVTVSISSGAHTLASRPFLMINGPGGVLQLAPVGNDPRHTSINWHPTAHGTYQLSAVYPGDYAYGFAVSNVAMFSY